MKNKSMKALKIAAQSATILGLGCCGIEMASAAAVSTLGGVASTITSSFQAVTKLVTAGSYLAGIGFSIGAIMKFKQHKDSPSQTTVGTPIALLVIAAALLFLPSLLKVAGGTIFGGGEVSGPGGSVFGVSSS